MGFEEVRSFGGSLPSDRLLIAALPLGVLSFAAATQAAASHCAGACWTLPQRPDRIHWWMVFEVSKLWGKLEHPGRVEALIWGCPFLAIKARSARKMGHQLFIFIELQVYSPGPGLASMASPLHPQQRGKLRSGPSVSSRTKGAARRLLPQWIQMEKFASLDLVGFSDVSFILNNKINTILV